MYIRTCELSGSNVSQNICPLGKVTLLWERVTLRLTLWDLTQSLHKIFGYSPIFFNCGKDTWREIYPLNCWSPQCSVVNCEHDAVQRISRTHPSRITETLYPSNSSFSFPHSLWQPPFYSLLLWVWLFYPSVESCSVCPFVTNLSHLA